MKILFLLLSLLGSLSQQSFATNFYIAPEGDDKNPGTKEKPFKTLSGARDAVRNINKIMTEDIVVYLRGGLYEVSETIKFEHQDSGFNGHKVIYRAFENEIPIFSGGIALTNWILFDRNKNIYQSKVPKGIYRQLYINGNRAIRARMPNRTSESTFGPYLNTHVTKDQELLIAAEDWKLLENNKNLSSVELVVMSHWYHKRIRIDKFRITDVGVVVSPLNSKKKITKHIDFYKGSLFFFENSFSFIDSPREWYHDLEQELIYLAVEPDVKLNQAHVTIPKIATLLAISGTPDTRVENLEFHGFTFENTNWKEPSEAGINMTQFAQPIGILPEGPAAAISVSHTNHIAFRNNVIRQTGGNALYLHNADYSDIEGNKIYQIAANGIVIDQEKINPKPEEQSSGVAIWNNYIKQVGQDYTNGGAILANNVRGLIVEHNLIYDMPYSGVQICNQPGKIRDVGCGDNRICYNHIHHTMQLHDDGGGIYTLGGIQKGTVIAENFLHDISRGEWAGTYPVSMIYLDNFSSQIIVRDNVIRGGKAEQRNGSKDNHLLRNLQENQAVEINAGIKEGHNPRQSSCLQTLPDAKLKSVVKD